VLPLSFAAFAHAAGEHIPSSPGLTVADLRTPDGETLLREMRLHAPALDAALHRYLRFGGLPAAVAEALGGAHEPADRLIENFVLPERLHIWQTARGGEIDFVCGPRRELDVVEVKYREQPGLSAADAAARSHPGRPAVLASKNTLHFGERYTLIPAHTLLWALG
jgi:predicted AAA+ superfamily ATPase